MIRFPFVLLLLISLKFQNSLCNGDRSFSNSVQHSRFKRSSDDMTYSNWDLKTPCTLTCGGGIEKHTRRCTTSGGGCSASQLTKYERCNMAKCPQQVDWRAETCAEFNKIENQPERTRPQDKWTPVSDLDNKCRFLNCKNQDNVNLPKKHRKPILDGIPCQYGSHKICINRQCTDVSCDPEADLFNEKRFDDCMVCGGDGTTCSRIHEHITETVYQGKSSVKKVTIPATATSILVKEERKSGYILVITNSTDNNILGGGVAISDVGDYFINDNILSYSRTENEGEHLEITGPLKDDITIGMYSPDIQRMVSIEVKVSYMMPIERATHYWKGGAWGECDQLCGDGNMTRRLYCQRISDDSYANDDACKEGLFKPTAFKQCRIKDCEASWHAGKWSKCTSWCGENNFRVRTVSCASTNHLDDRVISLDAAECDSIKDQEPESVEECTGVDKCPGWTAGPWSSCSADCREKGGNTPRQFRSVWCTSMGEGYSPQDEITVGPKGSPLPDKLCEHIPKDKKPSIFNDCTKLPICKSLYWKEHEWKPCEKCTDIEEVRNLTCESRQSDKFPDSECLNLEKFEEEELTKPNATRECRYEAKNKQKLECQYEWFAGLWNECQVKCEPSIQNRTVQCIVRHHSELMTVDDSYCDADLKPIFEHDCFLFGKQNGCESSRYYNKWTECRNVDNTCVKTRDYKCLTEFGNEDVANPCGDPPPEQLRKDCDRQICFGIECDNAEVAPFGCCPGNETYATDENFVGCGNCSDFIYGCCSDNATLALGPDQMGCEFLVNGTIDDMFNETMAFFFNETMSNMTMDNSTESTESSESSEETLDMKPELCNATAAGCCRDWISPRLSKDSYDADSCVNETVYMSSDVTCDDLPFGCCSSSAGMIAMARGPNQEGCGELLCQMSFFGCCDDQHTIATGPHYQGCDKSKACTSTEFGCCSDDVTRAAGPDGAGCTEECRTSKYGCCPDGETLVTDKNNLACVPAGDDDCSSTPFGCCQDGYSTAQGARFQGCPESCLQSSYGCCRDRKTPATGWDSAGCPCVETRFGCCPNEIDAARGLDFGRCDDCDLTEFGCCLDGRSKAMGKDNEGCPSTKLSLKRVASCWAERPGLSGQSGPGCRKWWFDRLNEVAPCQEHSGCLTSSTDFSNAFVSQEECEQHCVRPQLVQTDDIPDDGIQNEPIRCLVPKSSMKVACEGVKAWVQGGYFNVHNGTCKSDWWSCGDKLSAGITTKFGSMGECENVCKHFLGMVWINVDGTFNEDVLDKLELAFWTSVTDLDRLRAVGHSGVGVPLVHTLANADPNGAKSQRIIATPRPHIVIADPITVRRRVNTPSPRFATDPPRTTRITDTPRVTTATPRIATYPPRATRPPTPTRIISQPTFRPFIDPTIPIECNSAKDSGRCQERQLRYHYVPSQRQCSSFIYTGCGGNQNNFRTSRQCEDYCASTLDTIAPQTLIAPVYSIRQQILSPRIHHAARVRAVNHALEVPIIEVASVPVVPTAISEHDCTDPRAAGPCDDWSIRWFYNPVLDSCDQFDYGGCDGNGNNFESEEKCLNNCVKTQPDTHENLLETGTSSKPELCYHPVETGCVDQVNAHPDLFYYFDVTQDSCQPFRYHPCEHRQGYNKFKSNFECQRVCGHWANQQVCNLAPETGRCRAGMTRFYHNSTSGLCQEFRYGGCEGNANNFRDAQECAVYCADEKKAFVYGDSPAVVSNQLCKLPMVHGHCSDSIQMWHFDSSRNACTPFTYSGCGGNENRFETKGQCVHACKIL